MGDVYLFFITPCSLGSGMLESLRQVRIKKPCDYFCSKRADSLSLSFDCPMITTGPKCIDLALKRYEKVASNMSLLTIGFYLERSRERYCRFYKSEITSLSHKEGHAMRKVTF